MSHLNRYVASLLWIVYAAECTLCGATHQQAEFLASAYDEAMERCEFQGHFKLELWRVVAEAGSLEVATKRTLERTLEGYIAKRGTQFRFKSTVGGISQDVIEDGRLVISQSIPKFGADIILPPGSPPGGDLIPTVSLTLATEPRWGKPSAMCDLSPVHLFPSQDVFAGLLEKDAGVAIEITESNTTTKVSLTKEFDGTTKELLKAVFDISIACPMLTKRANSIVNAEGIVTRKIVWTMSEFRPAGEEVYVPSVIERRTWDVEYQRNGQKNVWFVARWNSADLGKRPVKDADFDIEVPAGVQFVGFLDREGDVSEGETISLSTFNPEDVRLDTSVEVDEGVVLTGAATPMCWIGIFITGIVIAVLLGMVLLNR